MKDVLVPFLVVLFMGWWAPSIVRAQQVPVEEAVEAPDAPAADAAQGDAEAQMPALAPADDAARGDAEVQIPAVGGPPSVEQPAVEP